LIAKTEEGTGVMGYQTKPVAHEWEQLLQYCVCVREREKREKRGEERERVREEREREEREKREKREREERRDREKEKEEERKNRKVHTSVDSCSTNASKKVFKLFPNVTSPVRISSKKVGLSTKGSNVSNTSDGVSQDSCSWVFFSPERFFATPSKT